MSNVLLLRAPSRDPEIPDRYESIFSASGYEPLSVPVLETVFTNIASLTDTVRNVAQYGAVIITSGRACEAWSDVVDALESRKESRQESDWPSVAFYVVGSSTASALSGIRVAHPHSPFAPTDIRGESSGTSEQLARFILADLKPEPSNRRPFLYLTGDKNRDTLPGILRDGNVRLSPLQVYQTQGSSNFSEDLKVALESSSREDSDSWWIVFFAPSAAEFVTPFLQHHFNLSAMGIPTSTRRRPARIASIGPTTSSFLRDKLNFRVDAEAAKPTPGELLRAIMACDASEPQ